MLLSRFASCLFCFMFAFVGGCAVLVENPGNPKPKSTEEGKSDRSPTGSPDSASSPQNAPAPASGSTTTSTTASRSPTDVALPGTTCTTNIQRSAAGGSGVAGAKLVLSEVLQSAGNALLYRDTLNNRFVAVDSIIFESVGTFTNGTYDFEFHQADSKSCVMDVTIDATDVTQNVKLTVVPSIPNQ